MSKLNPCRTLSLSRRHLVPTTTITPALQRGLTTSQTRCRPTNVGNLGLAEDDVQVGEQAPEPLTLEGIQARRVKAGRLVAGTAAYSDSDMFKSPHAYNQPKAKRWDNHLTTESKARHPCILKQAAHYLKKPGLISLGGGLPSPDNFPVESLTMRIPTIFTLESNQKTGSSAAKEHEDPGFLDMTARMHDIRDSSTAEYDLSVALNYGQSIGTAQLLRWVTEHTELVCRPPYSDWQCALTIGSTGALEQALRMFCDGPGRRDSIITEQYSFSTALETAQPLGISIFGCPVDAEGLMPESLDEMLTNWDSAVRDGARKPTVLYTVPSGQNPTGATMSLQRRKDIYAVCSRHDLFILEDEPYYFLQMPDYTPPSSRGQSSSPSSTQTTQTPQSFLSSLLPPLVSLDVDGRVLRMDSFSKVLSPGTRVGWITASEQVIERYIRHAECASQGPNGIAQLLLHQLVDQGWGHEGYIKWLMRLRGEYTRRRDAILDACEKHLPREVVSWVPPRAGMFLWMKVNPNLHPSAAAAAAAAKSSSSSSQQPPPLDKKTLLAVESDIFDRCIDQGVLCARGSWFLAEPNKEQGDGALGPDLFFRATFASASDEQMDEAIRRFGEAVRGSFGM